VPALFLVRAALMVVQRKGLRSCNLPILRRRDMYCETLPAEPSAQMSTPINSVWIAERIVRVCSEEFLDVPRVVVFGNG
jgi:hypothetical protein